MNTPKIPRPEPKPLEDDYGGEPISVTHIVIGILAFSVTFVVLTLLIGG